MANEKRLIDVKNVLEILRHEADVCNSGFTRNVLEFVITRIESIKTVDAVEVVHGRWENNEDDYPECDKCGYMPQYDSMIDDIWCSPYCPNCGAKMDGDGNG